MDQICAKRVFPVENEKKWTLTLNSVYSYYSKYQVLPWTDNFIFLDQIYPKRVFQVNIEKSEKGIFGRKLKKGTSQLNSAYSNYTHGQFYNSFLFSFSSLFFIFVFVFIFVYVFVFIFAVFVFHFHFRFCFCFCFSFIF